MFDAYEGIDDMHNADYDVTFKWHETKFNNGIYPAFKGLTHYDLYRYTEVATPAVTETKERSIVNGNLVYKRDYYFGGLEDRYWFVGSKID